jgi:uncharacterized membrane protein YphA (DoxX/SURF4 family)
MKQEHQNMSILQKASERQLNAALAILRVTVGVVFVAHGGQKLFCTVSRG